MKVFMVMLVVQYGGWSNIHTTKEYVMKDMTECLQALAATKIPQQDEHTKITITCVNKD